MTPRPTPGTEKTPRPTSTSRPTKGEKTPRPSKSVTPRPTVWQTPRPTKEEKTPKPTNEPKTPRPTSTYLTNPPKSTRTYLTPEPTQATTSGWGSGKPMTGCAQHMSQSSCSSECVWKSGYPPYAFSEDSKYQLLENEFVINGIEVDELLNNMDFQVFFGIGLLIAAVLVCAFGQYSMRKEKALDQSEYAPLVKV